MRYCFYVLFGAGLVFAQSTTTEYTTDINGNPVPALTTDSLSTRSLSEHTELSQSINGRTVPLEQDEEQVLVSTPTHKVTEKTVRKYDRTGNLISTEKIRTDEQKNSDGSSITQAVTFRSDVNGNMTEAERETTDAKTQGTTTTSNTVIERPTVNGSFETVEKQDSTTTTSGKDSHQTEAIFQRSADGQFQETQRKAIDTNTAGNKTVENTAVYTPNDSGQMQLLQQSVSTTTKSPDGSEVIDRNYYSRFQPGVSETNDAPQHIFEQDTVVRKKEANGTVVETVMARRPSVSDPDKLGDPQQISQIVCTGKCNASPAPAAPTPPTGP